MLKLPFILLIDLYRYCISPLLPRSCRFYPSCSAYARESIQSLGLCQGLYYSARRLLKCHPFHPGGFDPVPHLNKQEK